jgi:hypothetical protein
MLENLFLKYFKAKYGLYFEILINDTQDLLEKNVKFRNGKAVAIDILQKSKKRNLIGQTLIENELRF